MADTSTAGAATAYRRIVRPVRAWWLLTVAALRAELQYRANFALTIVGGLCYQGAGLAFVWTVLARFGTIGGWSLREITFLYAMRLTSHGLWVVPFNQLMSTDLVVQEGGFTGTWCGRPTR